MVSLQSPCATFCLRTVPPGDPTELDMKQKTKITSWLNQDNAKINPGPFILSISVSLTEPPNSITNEGGVAIRGYEMFLSAPCDSILLSQRKANDRLFLKSPNSAASSSRDERSIVIHLQQSGSI